MRSATEMQEQLEAAYAVTTDGGTKWPGMSYEEGVTAALSWALGDADEKPMSDD